MEFNHYLYLANMYVSTILFSLIMGFASNTFAQTTTANSNNEADINSILQPWSIACSATTGSGQLICSMSQVLQDKKTGLRIMSVVISSTLNSEKRIIRTQLPHGIDIVSGLNISIDDGVSLKYPINWADKNGSYSEFELTTDWLNGMRNGNLLSLVVNSHSGQRIEFHVSLKGFIKAFQKL